MTREDIKHDLQALIEYFNDERGASPICLQECLNILEQEPCNDVVSRRAVKEQMIKYGFHAPDMTVTEFVEDLSLINPQEKTGYWIPLGYYDDWGNESSYKCSECGDIDAYPDNYCSNCGADMRGEKV